MQQLQALEVIALSQAVQAFGSTMDGRDRYVLERRVRELTDLPDRGDPRQPSPHGRCPIPSE